jgi:hypothetical protein
MLLVAAIGLSSIGWIGSSMPVLADDDRCDVDGGAYGCDKEPPSGGDDIDDGPGDPGEDDTNGGGDDDSDDDSDPGGGSEPG